MGRSGTAFSAPGRRLHECRHYALALLELKRTASPSGEAARIKHVYRKALFLWNYAQVEKEYRSFLL